MPSFQVPMPFGGQIFVKNLVRRFGTKRDLKGEFATFQVYNANEQEQGLGEVGDTKQTENLRKVGIP